jgi:hypothetical protein
MFKNLSHIDRCCLYALYALTEGDTEKAATTGEVRDYINEHKLYAMSSEELEQWREKMINEVKARKDTALPPSVN